MDYSQLLNFDSDNMNYNSLIGLDVGNQLSQVQFKIDELRQKGEGLLSTELITGPLAAKGIKMSDISLDDIMSLPETAPAKISQIIGDAKTIGNDTLDVANDAWAGIKSTVSEQYDNFMSAYNGISSSVSQQLQPLTNPVASRLNEVDEEFGQTGEDIMSSLNTGLSKIPTSSSFVQKTAGDTEMADFSSIREPVIGSHSGTIGDAPAEVAETSIGEGVATDVGADVAAGATEAVGAALDATGIGAPIGILMGLVGLGAGGYGLIQGFEDIFSHKSDSVMPSITIARPQFQAT